MAQRLVLEAVGGDGDLCQRPVASHRLLGREQIPPRPFVSRLLPQTPSFASREVAVATC